MSNDYSHLVKGAIPPNTLIRPGSNLKNQQMNLESEFVVHKPERP